MVDKTYRVAGMTCGHCVAAVESAVSQVDGVDRVVVDLATGTVAVTGGDELDDGAVGSAVADAGYELVS